MLPYQTIGNKEERIAIVGVGGAGANILHCFGSSSAANVRLCIMSLDERVGRGCGNIEFLQLGGGMSRGLGSGGDPEVGQRAARESEKQLRDFLDGTRLLVMVSGLGGGTGSGAAPELARIARDAGLFLVSVVLMPFSFEGRRRREQAEAALESISRLSDIVFCFENDYMEDLFYSRNGARAVFEEADRLLAKATASVPMMASSPGLINLGLDELATALANDSSRCLFGSGQGYGPHRAEDAARAALESPLIAYHNALLFSRTVIVHIAGGDSMSLTEIRKVMETVRGALADEDVDIFFGTTVKPHLGDEIRVTLIASVNAQEFAEALKNPPAPERIQPEATETEVVDEEEETSDEDTPGVLYEEEESPAAPVPASTPVEPETEPEEDAEGEEEPEQPAPTPATPVAPPNPTPTVQPDFFRTIPAASHQTDLPFATEPEPRRRSSFDRSYVDSSQEISSRVRELFGDTDSDSRRTFSSASIRRAESRDDEDPPSLRFNDLRDIFPEK